MLSLAGNRYLGVVHKGPFPFPEQKGRGYLRTGKGREQDGGCDWGVKMNKKIND